jgi:hypothetical protein
VKKKVIWETNQNTQSVWGRLIKAWDYLFRFYIGITYVSVLCLALFLQVWIYKIWSICRVKAGSISSHKTH